MSPNSPSFDIAIVGCGFSGNLLLHHLVEQARAGLRIVVCDLSSAPGKGPAYSTNRPEHRLNVAAGRMGAFADRPEDFHRWAATRIAVTPEDFLPRGLYGEYLAEILAFTRQAAHAKEIVVEWRKERVADIIQGEASLTLRMERSPAIPVRRIVLATGNQFERSAHPRLITQPWMLDEEQILEWSHEGLPALIQGSGLTAVDVVLTLLEHRWPHPILCVSRRGWLPRAHAPAHVVLPCKVEDYKGLRLSAILKRMRAQLEATPGMRWQGLINGLRPHTAAIWAQLSVQDQRRFLTRYFTMWNVHRHRMAPDIAVRIEEARQRGRVQILHGGIEDVQADEVGVSSQIGRLMLRSSMIVSCTGPRYELEANPLLVALKQRGIVRPSACDAGLATEDGYCVFRAGRNAVYAMGALLIGERLETTAVPELRVQAKELATRLLA